jgi:hypothetical protein
MTRRPSLLSALLVSLAVAPMLPLACAVEDDGTFGGKPSPTGSGGSGGEGVGVVETACDGPLGAPQDPASLPACCPEHGGAHCVANVPPELADYAAPCDAGGYCVPDVFIATGGVYTPPSCTSLDGAPGVCLSLCVPEVKKFEKLLPQDGCAEGERCTPCVNPLDGTETGACDLSFSCEGDPTGGTGGSGEGGAATDCPHEGPPVLDPSSLPACPNQCGGHCVPSSLVPPDLAQSLETCDASSYCVPDDFIETGGQFIPPTCESVGGVEGRCLSTCLPDVAAQADQLPAGTCGGGERCVPCYDPIEGGETGACSLSCDPGPAGGPSSLPTCCEEMGTCVPSSAVPPDQLEQLGADVCPVDAQELVCVPDVFLSGTFTPQPCEAFWVGFLFGDEFEPGVCLPGCLEAVDNFLLGQDDCPDHYKCAPCLDPLSGEPSGACDPI